jgi:hypothetical protein
MNRYGYNFIVGKPAEKSCDSAITKEEVIAEYHQFQQSFPHHQEKRVIKDLTTLETLPKSSRWITCIRQRAGHQGLSNNLINPNGQIIFVSRLICWEREQLVKAGIYYGKRNEMAIYNKRELIAILLLSPFYLLLPLKERLQLIKLIKFPSIEKQNDYL